MAIDEVGPLYLATVSRNFSFRNCVGDFLTIFVFWKVLETVSPITACIWANSSTVHFFPICKKVDSDLTRTKAVTVVVILPGLASFNRNSGWSVGIGEVGSL